MKKRALLSLFLCLGLFKNLMFAQSVSDNQNVAGQLNAYEIGQVKFKVMAVISEFDNSYFLSGSDKSIFKACFSNLDVIVTNDILFQNKLDETLSLKEYLKIRGTEEATAEDGELLHNCKLMSFDQMTFDSTTKTGNIIAHVSRQIKWNKLKTNLVSHLSDTLNQRFYFNYQLKSDSIRDNNNNAKKLSVYNVKITKIENINKLGFYSFFESKEKSGSNYIKSTEVLVNGDLIKAQEDSYFFVKRILDTSIEVTSTNPEFFKSAKLRLSELDVVKTLKFYPPNLEFFFTLGTNLIGSRVFSNAVFNCRTGTQIHLNTGIGKSLYTGNELRVRGRLSFSYSRIRISSNLPSLTYMYKDIDPDNFRYNRIVNLLNINEEGLLNMFSIKGSIFTNRKFTSKSSIFCEFGALYSPKVIYRLVSDANVNYSGFYPDLFGLTVSENGMYDFGNFSIRNSENKLINSHHLSMIGEFGLLKTINKRFIMQAGISCAYLKPISFQMTSAQNLYISTNKDELFSLFKSTENKGALVYYLNTGIIYQFYGKK